MIDPPLLRLAGEVGGVCLLDLSCGNGYLNRRFARQGAVWMRANEPGIERARVRKTQEPLGITYHVGDAAHLEILENVSFDLVVCSMALMDIEDEQPY